MLLFFLLQYVFQSSRSVMNTPPVIEFTHYEAVHVTNILWDTL